MAPSAPNSGPTISSPLPALVLGGLNSSAAVLSPPFCFTRPMAVQLGPMPGAMLAVPWGATLWAAVSTPPPIMGRPQCGDSIETISNGPSMPARHGPPAIRCRLARRPASKPGKFNSSMPKTDGLSPSAQSTAPSMAACIGRERGLSCPKPRRLRPLSTAMDGS